MEIPINYPLSTITRPEYERALEKKKKSEERGGILKDVTIQEIAPGQFIGVIVMDEPV